MKKLVLFMGCTMALGAPALSTASARQVAGTVPLQFETQARLSHLESFSFERDGATGGAQLVLSFRAEDGSPDLVETDPLPGLDARSDSVAYTTAGGQTVQCAADSAWVDMAVGATFMAVGVATGNPIASGAGYLELERAQFPEAYSYNFNYANRCEVVIDRIEDSGDGSRISGRLVVYGN